MVTMKGHRGENNVITCYPDTKAPLNTFPQAIMLRIVSETSRASSRPRLHIYNLGLGVNSQVISFKSLQTAAAFFTAVFR